MSSSWKNFKDIVGNSIESGKKFYFRGQADSSWRLKTTYHRSSEGKGIEMKNYLTEIMYDVNYQVSSFDKPVDLSNSVEFGSFLAKLQHHGFPTPLLDWSLSPYIAAYFAFKGVVSSPSSTDSVSVFIMDIGQWMTDLKPINDLLGSESFLCDFVPYATGNPRMSRQMGVTTITNVSDLQDFIMSKGQYLWKYDMPVSERNVVMRELDLMGINDRTMFPDFDGLCKYLKEIHFDNKQKVIPPPPPLVPLPPKVN